MSDIYNHNVEPSEISPQGDGSTLDADTLDGEESGFLGARIVPLLESPFSTTSTTLTEAPTISPAYGTSFVRVDVVGAWGLNSTAPGVDFEFELRDDDGNVLFNQTDNTATQFRRKTLTTLPDSGDVVTAHIRTTNSSYSAEVRTASLQTFLTTNF